MLIFLFFIFKGFVIGFILTLSNYSFITCMIVFFLTSSKATKFRFKIKTKLEYGYVENSKRSWVQVICNGGVPFQFALLYMLEKGIAKDNPINFVHDYYGSWFATGVLGSIATSNGDTWASELGSILHSKPPMLITNFRRVPTGTNGGVSFIGILMSAIGGLLIGFTYYLTIISCNNQDLLAMSPPQWPIIIVGLIAGFIGSLIDSLLGATLQYSGFDKKKGIIVQNPGANIKWVSGLNILDNHSVNLLSTIIMGLITPRLSAFVWSLV